MHTTAITIATTINPTELTLALIIASIVIAVFVGLAIDPGNGADGICGSTYTLEDQPLISRATGLDTADALILGLALSLYGLITLGSLWAVHEVAGGSFIRETTAIELRL